MKDERGLTMAAASAAAVAAHDHVIEGYLKYRADLPERMQAALALDPDCPLLRVAQGCFTLLGHKQAALEVARDALGHAERAESRATPRERAHIAALRAWVGHDVLRAVDIWRDIAAEHPHDILAFGLHHACAFWAGRPDWMADLAAAVLPHWSPALPGYGSVLACRSFASEECGDYLRAEVAGREAISLDPSDLWAAHAVAHVLEMQGRRGEGIAFMAELERHWQGGNNMTHHLWWHRALYHLERREWAVVLDLYDRNFRDLTSPVTQAASDLYIDVQNAASMLFRLMLRGVNVGARWEELADKAETRIGDHLSAFTLPHWMMALAAAHRWDAAMRMLAAMSDGPPLVRRVALPVCQAVLHHGRGEFAAAVAAMRPALGEMHLMGGSHAQQDVLEQLFLDSAVKAGLDADVRLLLERVAGRHPVPPHRRVGYAEAARELGF